MRSIAMLFSFFALLTACAPAENRTSLPVWEPGDTPPPLVDGCTPDLDGRITAEEATPAIGVPVTFRTSPPGALRTVDLAGETGEGAIRWDWSAPASDDRALAVSAEPLAGKWYASSFPVSGAFVLDIDAGGALEAVYVHEPARLALLGYASAEPDPPAGRALVAYPAAVDALRFPLEPGSSWSTQATVQYAQLNGFSYAGLETYEISVDAVGEFLLPDLSIAQAHRVRTRILFQPLIGYPSSRRQVSWMFECFGEIARATSLPNEPLEDFTIAAEVRRLSL